MGKVSTGASMSLDGYIAGPGETGFEHLFKWNGNGDVPMKTADPNMTMMMTKVSHDYFSERMAELGALIVGRKLFDFTSGWGGRHPLGRKTVVLTHTVPDGWEPENEAFVFVHDGIEAAVERAKEIAGDLDVGVNGGTIARQCLEARLLDEIFVDLVPVLLGGGTPFFDHLQNAPVVLEGPITVLEGRDVTHLRYRVTYT
ncbi:dihydrofolate reductase family protein [Actinomadura rudentiformis]|uniref:Deaminase n=1 Tax=Actinomadura rudentiformis TaxID=359158 RepID=A0A6H9YYW2_9ACTN|nr:dihydrofolate reductase family protein [Actinomadura rudentiformis]KAB2350349.1 deaminase [Actinomadura rudentiformis]